MTAALDAVLRQDWPGNVREIEAFVVRLAASAGGPAVGYEDVKNALDPLPLSDPLSSSDAHENKAVQRLFLVSIARRS